MYHFNEGSIKMPKEWQDRTLHILTSAKDETTGLSFTISKDTLPWRMDFTEFVEKEIISLSRQLNHYQQIEQQTLMIAETHAVMSEFTWDSAQGPIHQLITFLNTRPEILIFTTSVPDFLSKKQKENIITILQTLRLNN